MSPASTRVLSAMLEARTGQQLAPGRRWRIGLALEPLMRERGLASLDAVAALLGGGRDPRLAETVVEALLNNETSFFRDPAAFDLLATVALPRLIAARSAERRLRLWCAGCSTGQEAYSLAMLLAEQEPLADWRIDIVATDISRGAVARARDGLYTQFEIQRGLSTRRMLRWFDEGESGWRAGEPLKARVRFHNHSLLELAPAPARFDVVLCRNVLLYFSAATRGIVFDRLSAATVDDGVLLLGAGETVIGQTTQFASDPEARGLYRPTGRCPQRAG